MSEFKNKKEIFSYLWNKIKLTFVLKDGTKVLSSNDYTTSEKSKLDGIEEGAQKNVQADWDATSGDTLILNKPSIPTALSELANDSGYIVGDLSQLETSEKESVILAINELLEKINSLKGGGGTTGGLTYSKVTLENGETIWKGSDNKYYTDKTSKILVSPGSYTLSTGKILTIYSDGTGILSDPQPEGSLNLSYVFSNTTPGDGSGSIILSTTDSKYYGSYDIYYANATGVLGNYQAINYMDTTSNTSDEDCLELELKAGSTEFAFENFLSANMIPTEATRIVAIKHTGNTHSGTGEIVAQYIIPESKRFSSGTYGSKLYSIGMLSDIHVDSATDTSSNDAGADVARALSYFVDYGITDVCCCGDITDDGEETQWNAWNSFISPYKSSLNFHMACGNHDARKISTWNVANVGSNNYGGAAGTYTVQTIGNDKYVFLGIHYQEREIFNATELAAFKADMDAFEADPSVGRVFMFEHAPIPATVGNPNRVYAYNIWTTGSSNPYATTSYSEQFASYMKTYSKCIWFSGHSHTKFFLQSLDPTANYYEYPGGCRMIHIPSCTYPREWQWDSATGDYTTQTDDRRRYNDVASSEGIIMDVYSNCVVIKGINFKQNKFVPIAQYLLHTEISSSGDQEEEPIVPPENLPEPIFYVNRSYNPTNTTSSTPGNGEGWYIGSNGSKQSSWTQSGTTGRYGDKFVDSIMKPGSEYTDWTLLVHVEETSDSAPNADGTYQSAINDVPERNFTGTRCVYFPGSGFKVFIGNTTIIGTGEPSDKDSDSVNAANVDHVTYAIRRSGNTFEYSLDGKVWNPATVESVNSTKVFTVSGSNSYANRFYGHVHLELYETSNLDSYIPGQFFKIYENITPTIPETPGETDKEPSTSTANILMYVDRIYSKSTDPFVDSTIGVKGRGTGWYMDGDVAKPTQCYIPSATNKFYIDKLPLQSLTAAAGTSKALNKATSITPSGTVTTLSKWMMMAEVQGAETGNDTNQNSGVFGRAICDVPDDNDSGITIDVFGQSGLTVYMRTTNPVGGGRDNPTSDGNTHVKIVMARDGETYSYTLDGSTWHTHETTTTPTDNAGKVLTLAGTNSLGNPFSGYVHMELYDDVDQTLVTEFFNTDFNLSSESDEINNTLLLKNGETWYIGDDSKVYSAMNGECDDAARAILGGSWRIPTIQDWKELCANTTQTIVTYDGTACLRLYNSKGSLYIPIGGYKEGSSIQSTSFGEIWLADSLDSDFAAFVEFSRLHAQNASLPYAQGWYYKYHGRNIRPVSDDEGVDLGLPSGLKWASMNLGAISITETGGYYAWGEITEKTNYTQENYKYAQNNNPYTLDGDLLSLGVVLAQEGEYELSNGKLLTVYSDGTYKL